MANKSFADKMVGLTNDRTVTTTPSFLEMLAPLMSILFFSGAAGDISSALEGGGKLPSADMMANQAAVQGAAKGIVGDIRGPAAPAAAGAALGGGANITPEQMRAILQKIGPLLMNLGIG
jgi:hypothetical protein